MPKKPDKKEEAAFNNILGQIAALVIQTVVENMGKAPWTEAVLDERQAGGGRFSKLSIDLTPESKSKFVRAPMAAGILMDEIWKLKNKLFPKRWYGLKLTVYPNGSFDTEFNYNRRCSEEVEYFKG